MRSFIVVTFAFLGFAFYELSGGSEYEPAPNSLQARAANKAEQADRVDVAVTTVTPADQDDQTVTRAASSLSDMTARRAKLADDARFEITLASIKRDASAAESALASSGTETESQAIEAAIEEAVRGDEGIVGETGEIQSQEVFSLETYVATQGQAQPLGTSFAGNSGGDLREVTGDRVNMRAGPGTDFERVGAVTKGTEVIVLDAPGNGWLMLEVVETGETGWMADWLVTASN